MLIFARIELTSASDDPVITAQRAKEDGADWIHVVDIDGEQAGAPQNVQWVHQILSACDLPLQFRGGVNLVHTADLILGLGATRFVIDGVLTKTERSPGHFFSRFGEGCIASISDLKDAPRLAEIGCKRVLYEGPPGQGRGLGLAVIAGSERNLIAGDGVSFEGVVVEPSRVRELARGRACSKHS